MGVTKEEYVVVRVFYMTDEQKAAHGDKPMELVAKDLTETEAITIVNASKLTVTPEYTAGLSYGVLTVV